MFAFSVAYLSLQLCYVDFVAGAHDAYTRLWMDTRTVCDADRSFVVQ